MGSSEWLQVPVGIDAQRLVTRAHLRNVLVVVHTVTSGQRLLDVVGYVETDPRVQVVFTHVPGALDDGVAELLARTEGKVLSWHQARREPFDLAIAAAYDGIAELHGPVLVMGHGAGFGKRAPAVGSGEPMLGKPPVYGLDAQRLTRNGRVVVSALALSHPAQLEVLRRQCPAALPVAVVAGDPCYDRLVASQPRRTEYRATLQVGDGQQLVVVSSTWGKDSSFGRYVDLLPWIMNELPSERFTVAAMFHPAVWAAHGRRTIKEWLRDSREAGLIVLDPLVDWRAAIVAADYVIGDHGSVPVYAAAIGRPVLSVAPPPADVTVLGSPHDLVGRTARRLDMTASLEPQLRAQSEVPYGEVAELVTSRPGEADLVLRQTMYTLLKLDIPGRHRRSLPVPALRTERSVDHD